MFSQAIRSPQVGFGSVELEASTKHLNGDRDFAPSEVVTLQIAHPFRFLIPENCTPSVCRWIYPITFGGGLVGGDKVSIRVKIGDRCAAVLSSQESTKVYHCRHSDECQQHTNYTVGNDALLCVLSDPIVCYRDACFTQSQVIDLHSTSNLVLLDWMLSGRIALEENWAFQRYTNNIEVRLNGVTVLKDNTEFEDTPLISVQQSMNDYQVYGTCIVLGSKMAFLAEELGAKYGRKKNIDEKSKKSLVVSYSPFRGTAEKQTISGCYLRFMASNTAHAAEVIQLISNQLIPILGADPFERKL